MQVVPSELFRVFVGERWPVKKCTTKNHRRYFTVVFDKKLVVGVVNGGNGAP